MKLTLLFVVLSLSVSGQSLFPTPLQIKPLGGQEDTSGSTEELKRIYFQSVSAVSSTEEVLQSVQGTQKLMLTACLRPQQDVDKFYGGIGIDVTFGINAINLDPNGVASDSFNLSSLMFPETGNYGLMFNPSFHWHYNKEDKSSHRLSSELSYSLRQNEVLNVMQYNTNGELQHVHEKVEFSVINVNIMPIRYTYHYQKDKDFNATFSLGLYFHWFNVSNEDADSFNKLYPTDQPIFETNRKSNVFGVGAKISASINGLLLFADLRQNEAQSFTNNDNPFKGFVFNAGIAQNINIFGL